jgi:antirestriction protein
MAKIQIKSEKLTPFGGIFSIMEKFDSMLSPVIDSTLGQYDDEEDFAYEIIEECYDLPEFAKTYFDYEKFARDLFMCDYWFDDGFVFRAA